MKHYKVLVSFLILFTINCLSGCNNKSNNGLNKTNEIVVERNINRNEKSNCLFTNKSLKNYEGKLEILYKNSPNRLSQELSGEAEKFSPEIKNIFSSVYESEFKVSIEYKYNSNDCSAKIYYLTDDTIVRDGETYNIESSIILILTMINNEIKIVSILMTG